MDLTLKERAKNHIWSRINHYYEYYADDFELWYKEVFKEYMQEALDEIDNGNGSIEEGTQIELPRRITKSGNPEPFFVDKEDLIEFYGKEYLKEYFEV